MPSSTRPRRPKSHALIRSLPPGPARDWLARLLLRGERGGSAHPVEAAPHVDRHIEAMLERERALRRRTGGDE
jgi:hypothetical protein